MKEKLFYVSAGFFVCLILAVVVGRWSPLQPEAHARSGGSAGETTVALGELHRGVMPVVLVDPVDDALLIYEADEGRNWRLELKSARTYRYDKQVREHNTRPEINQIRQQLGGQER